MLQINLFYYDLLVVVLSKARLCANADVIILLVVGLLSRVLEGVTVPIRSRHSKNLKGLTFVWLFRFLPC